MSMTGKIVLLSLFYSALSLTIPDDAALKEGRTEELPSLKDGLQSESEMESSYGLEMLNAYGLPTEITAMPGLDPKLLAVDLGEMELEPSSNLMDVAKGMNVTASQHKRTKPMMWVHIHKAAGTFMCAAAHLNGESVVKPGGNCNWGEQGLYNYGPDGGQGGFYNDKVSCEKRTNKFQKGHFSWGQTERALNGEFCFKAFDYGIWLRDPVKLALSEANYKYNAKDVDSNLKCVAEGSKCPEGKDDVPLWKYFDNYVVRILGGPEVYKLPKGQVTEQHAQKALALLSKFKVKVAMEKVLEDKQDLMEELGWSQWPAKGKDGDKRTRAIRHRFAFSAQEEEKIRKLNKYDYMLYDYVSKADTGLHIKSM